MSLDEFEDKVKSYKTFEEAEVLGNMEEKMKHELSSEIETLKHSNSVESEKLKTASLRQQQESDEAKKELAVAQNELKAQWNSNLYKGKRIMRSALTTEKTVVN